MRKYAPENISMWGGLASCYGTALGVGDKVESAMASLNIHLPWTGVPAGALGIGLAFTPLLFFTPPVRGGSGGYRGAEYGGGGGLWWRRRLRGWRCPWAISTRVDADPLIPIYF